MLYASSITWTTSGGNSENFLTARNLLSKNFLLENNIPNENV